MRPSSFCSRLISIAPWMESPPSSKKLSWTPIWPTPRISLHSPASRRSRSLPGAPRTAPRPARRGARPPLRPCARRLPAALQLRPLAVGRRQGLAVHLAARVERQRREDHEGRRGQRLGERARRGGARRGGGGGE